jgi:hypothetical protein
VGREVLLCVLRSERGEGEGEGEGVGGVVRGRGQCRGSCCECSYLMREVRERFGIDAYVVEMGIGLL